MTTTSPPTCTVATTKRPSAATQEGFLRMYGATYQEEATSLPETAIDVAADGATEPQARPSVTTSLWLTHAFGVQFDQQTK